VIDVYDEPEYAALIAAIRANPEDDTLRLAVADFLQERGQEARAVYVRGAIRVPHCCHVELTKDDPFPLLGLTPLAPVDIANPPGLVAKTCEPNYRTWMWGESDDLGLVVDDITRGLTYQVRRGFIKAVRCRAEDWLRHGDDVYAEHPVEAVTFSTDPYAGNPVEVRETLDGEQHFRLRGRGDWHPVGACRDAGGGFILLGLYALAWEGVRFTLPAARYEPPPVYTDGPERRGRVVTLPPDFLTRDYTSEAMAAAREAGRRAGERRARMDLARMMQWFGLPDADSGGTSPVTM
jgi:uncharacterized protein (TIGR02996 family)